MAGLTQAQAGQKGSEFSVYWTILLETRNFFLQ